MSKLFFLGEGDGEHWRRIQDPCWSRRAARHSTILDTRLGKTSALTSRIQMLLPKFSYSHSYTTKKIFLNYFTCMFYVDI